MDRIVRCKTKSINKSINKVLKSNSIRLNSRQCITCNHFFFCQLICNHSYSPTQSFVISSPVWLYHIYSSIYQIRKLLYKPFWFLFWFFFFKPLFLFPFLFHKFASNVSSWKVLIFVDKNKKESKALFFLKDFFRLPVFIELENNPNLINFHCR